MWLISPGCASLITQDHRLAGGQPTSETEVAPEILTVHPVKQWKPAGSHRCDSFLSRPSCGPEVSCAPGPCCPCGRVGPTQSRLWALRPAGKPQGLRSPADTSKVSQRHEPARLPATWPFSKIPRVFEQCGGQARRWDCAFCCKTNDGGTSGNRETSRLEVTW